MARNRPKGGLSDATIRELQSIFRDEYRAELSFDETAKAARDLTSYFDTLAEMASEEGESDAT